MGLIRLAIKRPIFVTMIFVSSVVMGLFGYFKIGVDLFPDIEFPIVAVFVNYPGANNEEMKKQVTEPIEDAISRLSGIKSLRSTTREGQSTIIVEFELGTDLVRAQSDIDSEISLIQALLPEEADDPLIRRFNPGATPIIIYSLYSTRSQDSQGLQRDYSVEELRYFADNIFKEEIQKIEGVGNVVIRGGQEREIHVNVDTAKMLSMGITYDMIRLAFNRENVSASAGQKRGEKTDFSIRVTGELPYISAIKDVVIQQIEGRTITVGDVAEVRDTLEEEVSKVRYVDVPEVDRLLMEEPESSAQIADKLEHAQAQLTVAEAKHAEFDSRRTELNLQQAQSQVQRFKIKQQLSKHLEDLRQLESQYQTRDDDDSLIGTLLQKRARVEYYLAKLGLIEHSTNSVEFFVIKQSGTNTVEIANQVKERIRALEYDQSNPLPDGLQVRTVVDFAQYIELSIRDVQEHLVLGSLLATLIVFLFLWNFRSTLITFLALPNSILGAFFIIWIVGFTQNVMTMLAFTLAIGLMIDDAIVVRENIFRQLERGASPRAAAFIGTKQVAMAVIATTATVIAVFLPVGLMPGVIGQFFEQFGFTVVICMLISLFDAFTMAPMLSSQFMERQLNKKTSKWNIEAIGSRIWNRGYEKVIQGYKVVLDWSLKFRKTTLLIGFGSLVPAMVVFGILPGGFLPTEDRREFAIILENQSGSSLQATQSLVAQVEEVLFNLRDPVQEDEPPEIIRPKIVDYFQTTVGNANGNSSLASISIMLIPLGDERRINSIQVRDMIREKISEIPGLIPVISDITAFGDQKNPDNAPFAVRLTYNDYPTLKNVTNYVFERMREESIDAADMDSTVHTLDKYELVIDYDREKMRQFGVFPRQLVDDVQTAIGGKTVGFFRDGEEEYPIVVRSSVKDRERIKDFEAIPVRNPEGVPLRLADIATVRLSSVPEQFRRENRQDQTILAAQVKHGGSLAGIRTTFEKIIADGKATGKIPGELSYAYTGQAQNQQELMDNVALAFGLGFLFIFMILAALYESFIHPFTILVSIPLSFIGAAVALLIANKQLDIFSMIGFILLLGLVTKNAILLVDYANQMRKAGDDIITALKKAGPIRLRPILMTTFAMIFGMLPIALGWGTGGGGRAGLAIVVVGGLISSTFLTLVFVPVMYLVMDQLRTWSLKHLFRRYAAPDFSGYTRIFKRKQERKYIKGLDQ